MSVKQSLEISEETVPNLQETLRSSSEITIIDNARESTSSTATITDNAKDESLTTLPSYDDPKNWSTKKKIFLLIIISFASIISPMANTIYYPAVKPIKEYFMSNDIIVNASISVHIFFTGTAPLFIGSFSDGYGNRRHLYLFALLLFTIPSVVCALTKSIWILIVMRAIQACGSSATQCLGAGVISDMYIPTERGRAYGILYLGFYIGDLGGPVIGGFLAQRLGFKWIFWFLTSVGCFLFLTIFFFLPETFRHNDIPQSNSTKPPCASLRRAFKKANPLIPLKLLLLPNVALKTIYMSSIWAFMYVQNVVIPNFDTIYNLSLSAIGLIYLAPGVGYLIGSIVGGRYSDYVLVKYESKHNGYSYPEIRLKSIWIGSMLLPISYYAFGWMIEYKINLIFPMIFMFLGGFGTLFVNNSAIAYLVDSYPELSASSIALSDFIPCVLATIYVIVTVPLQNVMGVGLLFTMLASINLVSIVFITLVYLKGKGWREKQNIIRHE